jgi:Fe-S cluster assembly iron-binding protein IscA
VTLKLTEAAAAAIKNLLEEAGAGEDAGLRVTAEMDETGKPGLHLGFEPEPGEEDQVVTEHGVNVFLDPSAAEYLEDKVLDAELHGDHAHFAVAKQSA